MEGSTSVPLQATATSSCEFCRDPRIGIHDYTTVMKEEVPRLDCARLGLSPDGSLIVVLSTLATGVPRSHLLPTVRPCLTLFPLASSSPVELPTN